ncbi:MAG: dTMP kinase [Coriobacteriia bacterium]|nr:dTMP kinase [Coriobacteriia bacterium]MCL2749773.1 dTMP kinase [Coriobacteriia bacterium]
MNPKAICISFEGGEGVGKSTQIRLLAHRLTLAGYEVCCLREPGGTSVGEQIRAILLNNANSTMTPITELLLYEAARAQLVAELIKPALAEGKVVLIDRFTDSTLAYQAFARGLNRDLVDAANAIGSSGLVPTRTILLDKDVELGLKKARKDGADRLEAESNEFHVRVHEGFKSLAEQYPERITVVPCRERKPETHEAVFAAVADLFNEQASQPFEITKDLLRQIKEDKRVAEVEQRDGAGVPLFVPKSGTPAPSLCPTRVAEGM